MSFKDRPIFVEHKVSGIGAIPIIKAKCPNVFMCLARSTNGNIVTYEFTSSNNIDVYWLLAEPSHGQAWRKQHGHDREELSVLERLQAYGVTVTNGKTSNQKHIVINSLTRKSVLVTRTKSGKAVAITKINGIQCIVDYIWVEAGGIGAKWVELHGKDPKTKQRHSERFK